jgi:hypothetical protein
MQPGPQDIQLMPKRRVQRVQDFRAHQKRMRREREDYFARTMQRARDLASG